jgi:glycolate oxidase subunit GlcD
MSDLLIKKLRKIVGAANVLDGLVDRQTYEYDAYSERHLPRAVVFVHSTEEVSMVCRLLSSEGVPFVARGYGTNVAGGTLALQGAIILQMGRMNKVLEVDIPNQCVVVQAGAFNADVSAALAPYGFYYAPDPSSVTASSIGGNIAMNAGGPHCFKYGVTSNYVLGLEVVLPDGEVVWLGGKTLDSPGLELARLFVGSEGTLGTVTAAALRILRLPETVRTMLAVFPTVEAAGKAVSDTIARGLVPATLEMMDNAVINVVEDSMACGFPRDAGAVLIIELDGVRDGMDQVAQEIAAICRACDALEVTVAGDEAEREALWRGRRGSFAAMTRLAPSYLSMDGVVPPTMLPEVLRRVREIGRRHDLGVFTVLHAGDGNLHPLVLFDDRVEEQKRNAELVNMEILAACVELGGAVSGEHGIGVEKLEAMHLVFSEDDLHVQRLVKEVFDPRGLANPGKLLPSEEPRSSALGGKGAAGGTVPGDGAPREAETAKGGRHRGGVGEAHGSAQTDGSWLARRIASVVGDENVSEPAFMDVRGLRAPVEVFPGDERQLAEVMRMAYEDRLAVCVRGGGTKLQWGNRPRRLDLLVSTARLCETVDLNPDDLTVTVQAGRMATGLRDEVAAVRRILPLYSARRGPATVGGVISSGVYGLRTAVRGGLKDVVSGVRVVLADGTVVRFGGRTMKNVAGYDMTKLFVGSCGTLGVISEATVRLLPRPDVQAVVVVPGGSLQEAAEAARRILGSHLAPIALEVASSRFIPVEGPVGTDEVWLVAGFHGHRAEVDRSVREVEEIAGRRADRVLEDDEADAFYEAIPAPSDMGPPPRDLLTARAIVPVGRIWDLAQRAVREARSAGLQMAYRVGAGRGRIEVVLDLASAGERQLQALPAYLDGLRAQAQSCGGSLIVREGLDHLPSDFDAWGDPGAALALMKRIKEKLDPYHMLNPGRYVGGM